MKRLRKEKSHPGLRLAVLVEDERVTPQGVTNILRRGIEKRDAGAHCLVVQSAAPRPAVFSQVAKAEDEDGTAAANSCSHSGRVLAAIDGMLRSHRRAGGGGSDEHPRR
jgi:hypothetical protein